MSDTTEVRPLRGEQEFDDFVGIVSSAFAGSIEDSRAWLRASGLEQVRVAVRGESVRGGLLLVPMGQFFGGRSVSMTGIAGVGVAPEHRGTGIAAALMQGTLCELAEQGVALSALYASTAAVYRAVGYELSGGRFRVRLRPRDIALSVRDPSIRAIEAADEPLIERAYSHHATELAGYLDRGPYIWGRVRRPNDQTATGYLVEAEGRVEGYVYLTQHRTSGVHQEIHCSDLVALNPRVGRRLLSLFADYRSLGEEVSWCTGPIDPLLLQLPDHAYKMELVDHWMLRIVNVEKALTLRGYPTSCRAELHLDVTDTVIPQNRGRYVLSVDGGRVELGRGGIGALEIDVRGLAPMYAGFLSPEALRRCGLLQGDEQALAAARDLFAGPAPAMSDSF
jgi:predicted acetyltransferase